MEHLGSSGPFPTEPEDLPGEQGRPCHQPRNEGGAPLTAQPPGPPALSSIQIELASHRGGPTASDATCPLE